MATPPPFFPTECIMLRLLLVRQVLHRIVLGQLLLLRFRSCCCGCWGRLDAAPPGNDAARPCMFKNDQG